MRALVLTRENQFEYTKVPRPAPQPGEVLVRVKAVGICGSDVHGMTGKTGRRIPPIIMGHEAAGLIAECGTGVETWSVGERVTFDSTVYCGACAFCRAGRINLCSARRVLGVSCKEYRRDGAMAEYVAVPERILYRLPPTVSFEEASLIEPISVAFHAVGRAQLKLGQSVIVLGCGIIGLLVIRAARLSGCGELYAVDVNSKRLEAAREMGADVLIDSSRDDPASAVREGGGGVDVGFEAVGLPGTVRSVIDCVRRGGRVVLVGNVSPEVPLALQSVVTGEVDLLGSCASAGEYGAILQMMGSGRFAAKHLISATVPLAEGADWFRRLSAAKEDLLKVILAPGENGEET